ncbi:MAG: arylsulfatase [Fermentimonas sp.]|jgi:arylsulfatase A-like enzyme|nr:arylsulfatase [Fermentimonas sp.]MDD3188285.1 arylsulfatase [Fermentimonas sp.]HBT86030.1 arylsulfatase [Porphyromonadaceae bacterium]
MSKRRLTATALGVTALTSFYAQDKPNILFILTDDLGYGDLSCYGQDKFQTPNIDRLALSGTRFTRSYSGTTVSAPSRASLLTGLHTGHTPIRGNKEIQPEGQAPLPDDIYTIFRLFKDAGYVTGAFGKWGLGYPGSTGDPVNQGVDHFFGYNCQRLAHNYYPSHLWDNNKKVEFPENDNGKFGVYSQDLIQKKALEFIEEQKDNPFFIYVPIVLPHAELVVPEDSIIQSLRGKFAEIPFKGTDTGPNFRKGGYMSQDYPRATHAAMVMRIDMYVAQIVDKLKEEGLYDNTLIIFTSDNGPHREGGGDPEFFNSNGIYRGYKRDLYEGGIRVPTIISWKGKVASGKECSFPFAFWDYLPTFADLLQYDFNIKSDGISILPSILGQDNQKDRDYFYFEFHESGGRQAVIKGDWKLLHLDIRNGGIYELYNIASDPSEYHNIINLYPEKTKELKEIMKSARTEDPNWPLF